MRRIDRKPCPEAQQPPRPPQHRLEGLPITGGIERQRFRTHHLRRALLEQPVECAKACPTLVGCPLLDNEPPAYTSDDATRRTAVRSHGISGTLNVLAFQHTLQRLQS